MRGRVFGAYRWIRTSCRRLIGPVLILMSLIGEYYAAVLTSDHCDRNLSALPRLVTRYGLICSKYLLQGEIVRMGGFAPPASEFQARPSDC